ncbi:MAG: CBS domain-containing protein [Magnetospirillum sp.]|nr:CBS domain-containing protein [Magnetospirillum sp.]
MSVEAILKHKGRHLYTIRPEHTMADAAALLAGKRVGATVVCDAKGRIVGIVSERDVVIAVVQFGKGALEMPVRNIMSSPVLTCDLSDSVKRVMEIMNDRHIRHLPVVDGEELVGMVSIRDAVDHRLRETQLEVGVLRDFAAVR